MSASVLSLVIITPDFPSLRLLQDSVQPSLSGWLLEASPAVPIRPSAPPPVSPGALALSPHRGAATVSAAATPPPASASPATSPAPPAGTPAWPAPPPWSSGGKPQGCQGRNTKLAASRWMPPRYFRQEKSTSWREPKLPAVLTGLFLQSELVVATRESQQGRAQSMDLQTAVETAQCPEHPQKCQNWRWGISLRRRFEPNL